MDSQPCPFSCCWKYTPSCSRHMVVHDKIEISEYALAWPRSPELLHMGQQAQNSLDSCPHSTRQGARWFCNTNPRLSIYCSWNSSFAWNMDQTCLPLGIHWYFMVCVFCETFLHSLRSQLIDFQTRSVSCSSFQLFWVALASSTFEQLSGLFCSSATYYFSLLDREGHFPFLLCVNQQYHITHLHLQLLERADLTTFSPSPQRTTN